MIFEGFNFIIDNGLAGVLVIAIVLNFFFHYKLDKSFKAHSNEDRQLETNERCTVRKGEFKKIFDKIEVIEKKDSVDDEKFNGIDLRFDHLETAVSGIANDVKEILMHLAKKGMN